MAFHLEGEFGPNEPKGIWMRGLEASMRFDLPAGNYQFELRCNSSPELAAAGQSLHVVSEGDTLASAALPGWGSEALLSGAFRQPSAGPRELRLLARLQRDRHAVYLRGFRLRAQSEEDPPPAREDLEAWREDGVRPRAESRGVQPDILLLLLDAARADRFGCYGYARSTTPNVDRLASGGIVLLDAHSTASYTRAAMPSLFSGSSWLRHGVIAPGARLPAELTTMAELLARSGYHTLGITTNPESATATGLDRGFAEFHETWKHPDRERLAERGAFEIPAELFAELLPVQPAERPLFAYLHLIPPHQPYDPGAAHDLWRASDAPDWTIASNALLAEIDEGRRSPSEAERQRLSDLYDGNLHRADAIVGRILDLHRAARPDRELCVVLLSDHGEAFGEHGRYRHSSTVHAEMTRIPMIFWPRDRFAKIESRREQLTAISDLLPLLISSLDLELDPRFRYPRHLLELHADPAWRRPAIWIHATQEIGRRDERALRIVRRFGAPEEWIAGQLQPASREWFAEIVASLRELRVVRPQPESLPSTADRERLRALGYLD